MDVKTRCPRKGQCEIHIMQKIKGEWLAIPKHEIGRRKKGLSIHPIWAAMDVVKPGCVPRHVRFWASLEQADVPGGKRNLRAIARYIDVYEKVLTDYVYAHDRRWGKDHRKAILKAVRLLCGSTKCEPWLTAGAWTEPNGTECAPRWLVQTGTPERVSTCVRTISLALYRAQATGSRRVGPADIVGPRAWWRSWWIGTSGRAWTTMTFWKPWLSNMTSDEVDDFRIFIAAMWTCSLTLDDVIRSSPFDRGRAYEAFLAEHE